MSGSRNRHHGEPSKVYRQARETATYLHDSYLVPQITEGTYRYLKERGISCELNGPDDVDRLLAAVRQYAATQLARVSARYALPALHQFVVDHYWAQSRRNAQRTVVLAPAKMLAMRVFERLEEPVASGSGSSRKALAEAHAATYAEHQLESFRLIFEIRPETRAAFGPDGIDMDEATTRMCVAFSHLYGRGGQVQRFADGTTERIYVAPQRFLSDAMTVLAGEPPGTRPSFAGSRLAQFPGADEAHHFWLAFAARLQMLCVVKAIALRAGPELAVFSDSAVLLSGPGLHGVTATDVAGLQAAVMDLFWQRAAVRSLPPTHLAFEFVDRPVSRFSVLPARYVTSSLNVADSLTALVENAVMPSKTRQPYALAAEYFERLVSKPFEAHSIQAFREQGFIAGEVSEAGFWDTDVRPGLLSDGTGGPGAQIDMLAWHPSGMVVLADCKVLAFPRDHAALRTQWQELTGVGKRKFRSKLLGHAGWVERALAAAGLACSEVLPTLLLDRPLHLWHQQYDDGVLVTDLDSMLEFLPTLLDHRE